MYPCKENLFGCIQYHTLQTFKQPLWLTDKTIDEVSTSPISKDQWWRIVAFLIWGRSPKRDIVEAVTEQEATTGVNDAYRWLHWQEHSCQKRSRLGLTSEGQVWEGPVCYTTTVPDPDADNSSMHPQSTDPFFRASPWSSSNRSRVRAPLHHCLCRDLWETQEARSSWWGWDQPQSTWS